MEQNKDQSGAGVRALPSDLTEREQIDLLCQVENYMSITEKHSQTAPEAVAEETRMYGMVNSFIAKRFSDIGAAVRGEAVAGLDGWKIGNACNGSIVIQKEGLGGCLAERDSESIAESILYELACSVRYAPVSARAADAPSEPSVLAMRAVLLNAKAVIKRWGSPLWRQEVGTAEFVNQLRNAVELAESRAADALDSQPSGKSVAQWLRNNYQDYPNIASLCDALEGGALDSQPTDGDGCDECRHTYCLNGEICRHCGDVNGTQGWKGGRQPTDGGVRNG